MKRNQEAIARHTPFNIFCCKGSQGTPESSINETYQIVEGRNEISIKTSTISASKHCLKLA